MRINEIAIDPQQSVYENLVSSTVSKVETLYNELKLMSSDFSNPAHVILPKDTIDELVTKLLTHAAGINKLQNSLPQTSRIIEALLQYLDT